ncbi:MAG: tetratricopeptide repeat protein [Bacteroidetes bacterium]|nr:tetratricopeptide repeat protein [Bacteroidota bacterium]
MPKHLILLLFYFLFGSSALFAQSRTVDSLKKALNVSKNDTAKVNLLNALSYEVYVSTEKSTDEIKSYIDSAIALSEKLNYLKGNLRARFNAGNIFSNTGKNDIAKKYLNDALPLCEKLKSDDDFFRILNTLGKCYNEEGNYTQGAEYYYKALNYAEKTNNKKFLATSYNSLGNIFSTQKEYAKAIHYFSKALKFNTDVDDKLKMSFNYLNLGNTYTSLNRHDSALFFYNKALGIQTKQKNIVGQAYSYNNIGFIYFKKNEPSAALDYYKRAYAIAKSSEDADLYSSVLLRMGSAYLKMNNIEEALKYYTEAEDYTRKAKWTSELSEALAGLSKIYRLKADYKKALDYYTEHKVIKDSMNNAEVGKKLSSLEYNYQIEQDKKITELENEQVRLKHEEEVRTQRIIIWSISIFLLVVFVLSIFIYKAYKQKEAANKIISSQKSEMEKQKNIVEEKQKEILDSINYAKRIQYALLAHSDFLQTALPQHFILFKPKDIVSGDFYWAIEHNHSIYVAVCDCTGHGVPGAFMSVLNIGFLNEAIKEKNITKPNEIFNYVRKKLIENLSQDEQKDGMDGVLLCIDKQNKKITYAAANNAPVFISHNSLKELDKDKMPVGKGIVEKPFTLYSLNYNEGDTLYIYTDGYADQFGGPKGKKFKYRQLNDMLLNLHTQSVSEQKNELEKTIASWKGELEQVDDLCIMGIKF